MCIELALAYLILKKECIELALFKKVMHWIKHYFQLHETESYNTVNSEAQAAHIFNTLNKICAYLKHVNFAYRYFIYI